MQVLQTNIIKTWAGQILLTFLPDIRISGIFDTLDNIIFQYIEEETNILLLSFGKAEKKLEQRNWVFSITLKPNFSNNLSLKYQRFSPSGCKDIGILKIEFVAKIQFL